MSCIFRVLKTQGDEKLSERLSKNECSTRSCQSHSTAWATIIDNAACSTTGRLLLLILLLSTFSCSPPRAKVINSSVSLSAIYTWIVNVCRSEWYRHRTAVLFSRGCRIVSSRSNLGKLFTLMSLCHWLPWRTILGWKKNKSREFGAKKAASRPDTCVQNKILFGVIRTKSDKLYSLRNQTQLRGHNYTLNKPRCNSQTRQSFF